ncbi:Sodium channel protein para (Protein paralytic) (Sodium channel 1) (DmNav1), partial [Durusdinium trenchii]
ISSIYTFLFTSELLLRILVRGIRIFWGEDWGWMLLDAAIVISSLFEFVIEANLENWENVPREHWENVIVSSSNDTEQANVFTNMRLLRILRVAKITRAFRIVRLVRFIRSLRTLLLCIGRTLRAMAWSAVLLLLIMFLFALIFTDLCAHTSTRPMTKLRRGPMTRLDRR